MHWLEALYLLLLAPHLDVLFDAGFMTARVDGSAWRQHC